MIKQSHLVGHSKPVKRWQYGIRRFDRLLTGALSGVVLLMAAPAVHASDSLKARGIVIVRGEQGVPHITASNYEKLAYGLAWTLAEDNLCEVAINRLKVRGELAQTFGPDIPLAFGKDEVLGNNIASDFYYRLLQRRGFPKRGLKGSAAPSDRARASVRGFVRGYNDFLRKHRHSDSRCAGASWLKPLTEREMWLSAHRYDDWMFDFNEQLNARSPRQHIPPASPQPHAASAINNANSPEPRSLHSQAIALGSDVTGVGAIVAYDPHVAPNALYGFARLTIPGQLDVFGHRKNFSPALYAGANANFSWALTATNAQQRVIRRLALVPGTPTQYIVDGKRRRMGRESVRILVKEQDGTLSKHTKTFYTSLWGDIIVRGDGSQPTDLQWTEEAAYAVDELEINLTSQRLFDYHIDINRAGNFADLKSLVARWGGFLDSQITGADTSGNAFYFGAAGAANIDSRMQDRCINTEKSKAILQITGEPVLDGSTTQCRLQNQPGAFRPGTIGVDGIPKLQSRLYTFNANNSHWIVTRSQQLEGFLPFFTTPYSAERRPISPRARLVMEISEELVQQARNQARRLNAEDVAEAFLAPRDVWAGSELEGVIAWCRSHTTAAASNGAQVPIADACDVLARWDGRHRHNSRGGALWRLFWGKLEQRFTEDNLPMSTPAIANNPLRSPRGLHFTPEVEAIFADAVQAIRQAGLGLDVAVGETVRFVRSDSAQPLFPGRGCGDGLLGCNVVNGAPMDRVFVNSDGSGTSAVFVAQLRAGEAATVKYYSPLQVRNPRSPWYTSNMTMLYSSMGISSIQISVVQRGTPNAQNSRE